MALAVAVVAAGLAVPSPAHASSSWYKRYGNVNTNQGSSGCNLTNLVGGAFPVPAGFPPHGNSVGCTKTDGIDNTVFKWDAGGAAWKCELRSGGSTGPVVAKVEFHPYDEVLWIYDTRPDGDAIYVSVIWEDDTIVHLATPPNTGDWDILPIQLSGDGNGDLPEGDGIGITVSDDADGNTALCSGGGIT